jgi:Nif-specific regulatory protein
MSKGAGRDEHLQLVTIYEISKILGSSLDLSKTLHQVLNVLSIHLETRRGMITLMHESGELHLAGASGMSGAEFQRCKSCVGEDINARIFQSGLPIVLTDMAKEPRFGHCTHKLEAVGKTIALIGVPIKAGREVLGVITIERVLHESGHIFDQDVHLLKMVANLVGQTVRLHSNINAERSQLLDEKRYLQKELKAKYSLDNVVGVSKVMQKVFAEVHQSAPSRSTILLRGESGTGKEVIARGVHYLSPRKDGPFIKVNCAALSETLLESELFGHEKGAFTGAHAERKGRFELANGGTLFLDEIGEISPAFQAKLLRVLQEREFERVGGNRPIKVDVRLITATNRDLERAVANGDFRADLYFRINVVSIFLPPLRERREDILPLVGHFLDAFNRDNRRGITMSPEALGVLGSCHWPGNVRELENCIERVATMSRGEVIREQDFPCLHSKCLTKTLHDVAQAPAVSPVRSSSTVIPIRPISAPAPSEAPPESERERLIWALDQCRGVQARAARLLNVSARQFGYALQKHNIQVRKF